MLSGGAGNLIQLYNELFRNCNLDPTSEHWNAVDRKASPTM